MAVFNLATRSKNYEMIMFPDPYAKNGSRLMDGKLCLVHGLIGRRNGEMSLAAHEVYDLETSIPKIIQRVNFLLHPTEKQLTSSNNYEKPSMEQAGRRA